MAKTSIIDLTACSRGWLMALKHSEDSRWGRLAEFLRDLRRGQGDQISIRSKVWGRMYRSGLHPQEGDGIAFYHSRRAVFPKPDPYRGRPRVSAFGVIDEIKYDGQQVRWLGFRIPRGDLERSANHPVVRTPETERIFHACDMTAGRVGTFWPIPRQEWLEMLRISTVLSETDSTIASGGFADPRTQQLVDGAAIEHVHAHYTSNGWRVRSVEAQKLGYDLVATRRGETRHLEVKGVSGGNLEFVMTEGERNAALRDKLLSVVIVTNALTSPSIVEYSGGRLLAEFSFRPIQYIVRRKSNDG